MCYSVAKEVSRAIRELSGVNLLVSTKPLATKNKTVHIRYGGTEPSLSNEPLLNSIDFIRLSSNKKALSDLLVEKGIRTVQFFPKSEYNDSMGVVLVRDNLYSFGGRGITLCKTTEEVKNAAGNWVTPFLRFTSEYRVHLFNGKIIRIQKKVDGNNEPEEFPIRNHTRGYFFSVRSTLDTGMESFSALQGFVTKVVEQFPEKHFCGLDIGKTKQNHYVIENNSAVGLEESTLYLYASEFCKELGFKIKVDLDKYILPTTEGDSTNEIRGSVQSNGRSNTA